MRATRVKCPRFQAPQGFLSGFILSKLRHVGHDPEIQNETVYIDAFSHAKITQNRNRNVLMTSRGVDLILTDYSNNEVYLENKNNILYEVEKQNVLLEYNETLLKTKTT